MARSIRVGTAGFSYKEWEGIVYPASFKSAQRLERVSDFLDLIEINTSFYGPIKPAAGREWCRAVANNREFLFTAKLYRAFTHSPVAAMEPTSAQTIRFNDKDVTDTIEGFDSLAERGKLGAVLAQFPISFKRSDANRAHIEDLVRRFRRYPLVLEVRHSSWNQPEIQEWLRNLGVGLCNLDQPLLGRAIGPAAEATAAVGYVRLHGRNYQQWFAETNARDRYDYLYSEKELGEWKARVETISAQAEATFVVANNHNLGKSAVNAIELLHLLHGSRPKAPASLVSRYPELQGFALPL